MFNLTWNVLLPLMAGESHGILVRKKHCWWDVWCEYFSFVLNISTIFFVWYANHAIYLCYGSMAHITRFLCPCLYNNLDTNTHLLSIKTWSNPSPVSNAIVRLLGVNGPKGQLTLLTGEGLLHVSIPNTCVFVSKWL